MFSLHVYMELNGINTRLISKTDTAEHGIVWNKFQCTTSHPTCIVNVLTDPVHAMEDAYCKLN